MKISDNGVERNMTETELAAYTADMAQLLIEQTARQQMQADATATRASAVAKLKALGLTDAEVAALVGG